MGASVSSSNKGLRRDLRSCVLSGLVGRVQSLSQGILWRAKCPMSCAGASVARENRWPRAYLGCPRPSLAAFIVGPRGSEKDQVELSYLDFVAVGQDCRLHRDAVDVGAVETADVDDLELAVLASELGVPATDGDVIAEDIAVGVSPADVIG